MPALFVPKNPENAMKRYALDTETTGLSALKGDRLIEIALIGIDPETNAVLPDDRFVVRLNPGRPVSPGAVRIHGITEEMLAGCPTFESIADRLVEFVRGAELVIHNAPFDLGFIDAELDDAGCERLSEICTIIDTLAAARVLHPGEPATLDALCGRYGISLASRKVHGALVDAVLLAEVYGAMAEEMKTRGVHVDTFICEPARDAHELIAAVGKGLSEDASCAQLLDRFNDDEAIERANITEAERPALSEAFGLVRRAAEAEEEIKRRYAKVMEIVSNEVGMPTTAQSMEDADVYRARAWAMFFDDARESMSELAEAFEAVKGDLK